MSITIPTGDLVGILGDVIPFAFPDDDLPPINCVRLEWDGDTLHAIATDRYRYAWSQWVPGDIADDDAQQDTLFADWGSGDLPWATSISLGDAKEIVKVFNLSPKERQVPLTVDYDPASRRTKIIRTRETGHQAITTVAEDLFEPYPDVRELLANHDKIKAVRNVCYNAKLLADFSKVRPRGPMRLTFTGGLTQIAIGSRFVGAIVPATDPDELARVLRDGAGVLATTD